MNDAQLRNLFSPAISFVMARRKESGGFGATRRLPATIQDTYFALNILNLARKYDPAGETADLPSGQNLQPYLTSCLRHLPAIGINTIFHLLWSCRTARVEFDRDGAETTVRTKLRDASSLEEWYYGARILTEILDRLRPADGRTSPALLAHGWRCADEAWMQIYLARLFAVPLPRTEPEVIAWLQACQSGDGGFGFFPGTTSFIENCHACLRALAFLGTEPADPVRAVLFLRSCQTASGGFSRGGRAAPFLDATWHGLAALALTGALSGKK